ncbi:MAG TPA: helix-turn-helix transcriptional regulator [Dehalococcoidia bacterium]|nr:helix-turn-helix transcriptional regulator [Dehalococcoidia bacterium]
MRGRPSGLLPLELSILETALQLKLQGTPEFHGFMVAALLREDKEGRLLTARGTLYKALDRLEKRGLLQSTWEDPNLAAAEGRPRRRLYQITAAGESALAETVSPIAPSRLVRRTATP